MIVYLEHSRPRPLFLPVQLLALKESYMNKPEEELKLHLRSRTTETVSIKIPIDTLRSLEKVAANRDMIPILYEAALNKASRIKS